MVHRKSRVFVALLAVIFVCHLIPIGYSSDTPELLWEKSFGGTGGDIGRSIQTTDGGGYILTGMTYSSAVNGYDVYLVKTDSDGTLEWEKTFGGTSKDEGYSVQVTTDGGYIITGVTQSFGAGNGDVYLLKTDSEGNLMWENTFGGTDWDQGNSVQLTKDGGYIITGGATFSPENHVDVYLVKTDSEGNLMWEKTFGSNGWDEGYSVQTTVDGGYIITGMKLSLETGTNDAYLIKTDSEGTLEWEKTYGGTNQGNSVQVASDGGYIITGETKPAGTNYGDVYLIKTDWDGILEWNKTYGGQGAADRDGGRSVQLTSDGGYIVTGYSHSDEAKWGDVYLLKTDSEGTLEWEKTFGDIGKEYGYSVQVTTDGDYILSGSSDSAGAGYDNVYLVKLDSGFSAGEINPDVESPVEDDTTEDSDSSNSTASEIIDSVTEEIVDNIPESVKQQIPGFPVSSIVAAFVIVYVLVLRKK